MVWPKIQKKKRESLLLETLPELTLKALTLLKYVRSSNSVIGPPKSRNFWTQLTNPVVSYLVLPFLQDGRQGDQGPIEILRMGIATRFWPVNNYHSMGISPLHCMTRHTHKYINTFVHSTCVNSIQHDVHGPWVGDSCQPTRSLLERKKLTTVTI